MDLFAAAEGMISGEVPREVYSGVIWDDAAEDEFGKMMTEWAARFPKVAGEPKTRAQVEQTARWQIELRLLQRAIASEVEAALCCADENAKRRLHTVWLRTYGAKLTDTIVRHVKDPALRDMNRGIL